MIKEWAYFFLPMFLLVYIVTNRWIAPTCSHSDTHQVKLQVHSLDRMSYCCERRTVGHGCVWVRGRRANVLLWHGPELLDAKWQQHLLPPKLHTMKSLLAALTFVLPRQKIKHGVWVAPHNNVFYLEYLVIVTPELVQVTTAIQKLLIVCKKTKLAVIFKLPDYSRTSSLN